MWMSQRLPDHYKNSFCLKLPSWSCTPRTYLTPHYPLSYVLTSKSLSQLSTILDPGRGQGQGQADPGLTWRDHTAPAWRGRSPRTPGAPLGRRNWCTTGSCRSSYLPPNHTTRRETGGTAKRKGNLNTKPAFKK